MSKFSHYHQKVGKIPINMSKIIKISLKFHYNVEIKSNLSKKLEKFIQKLFICGYLRCQMPWFLC